MMNSDILEEIILVDEDDNIVGHEEKVKAHKDGGKLHRSFSIFVFSPDGKLLIQRRADSKYHFAGLWSNTCCSHPRKDEDLEDAVHRRLQEEFGFDTNLEEGFPFIYRVMDDNSDLTEFEFDHTFIGTFDGEPDPNPEEIGEHRWVSIQELKKDIKENPQKYTPWFKIAFPKMADHTKEKTDIPIS